MRGNSGFCARRRNAFAYFSQYFCGGVAGHNGRGYHAASRGFHFFAADNLVTRPVAAFHKNVWEQGGDGALRRQIVKNDHAIDAFKRCKNLCALVFGNDRASLAFELSHARVTVQTDDERVAEAASMLQAADVAGMQQVEAAVGEHHAAPIAFVAAKPQNRLLQCEDGIQRVSVRDRPERMVKLESVVYHAHASERAARGATW
jgi:hypothetical protein